MVFDASSEGELMSAIFTTNMVMKRLAVGFSFFHAGALVESMIFAGVPMKVTGKFVKQAFGRGKTEIEELIDNPGRYLKEFTHANQAIKDAGFNDVVRFAQANRLVISTPEDVGFDRFYAQMRKFDRLLKHQFGIKQGENIEKVNEFKSGKEKLFGFFVGQVMKKTEGKANPQLVNEILTKKLNKN